MSKNKFEPSFGIVEFAEKTLGFKLYPFQMVVLEQIELAMRDNKQICIQGIRQGKRQINTIAQAYWYEVNNKNGEKNMNDKLMSIWLDIKKINDRQTLEQYLFEKSKCELIDLSLLLLDYILVLRAENREEI